MITDALIQLLGTVVHGLLSVLPHVSAPGWLSASDGAVSTVFQYADSMGVWFPTGLAVTVLGALLATWGVGFAIKGVRIVLSFLTLGGGSAA